MITTSINYLKNLQTESGLFRASPKNVSTGYDRIWIRDNLYISLAFESVQNKVTVEKIYHSLLNLLIKFEWKIDDVIKKKPTEDYKFIHPLYTENLEEIEGGWGWKQNDAIGGLLYFIGYLQKQNYNIICNENYKRILNKLVQYLYSIRYWEDEDNGIWEENKEIHSSSVGACLSGLEEIKTFIDIPEGLVKRGRNSLSDLLPNESKTKNVDMSLLSLIYPYNIVDKKMSSKILENVEASLVRKKGLIRYPQDKYYFQKNKEASWTMGFPWMAICHYQLGNIKKYQKYIKKTIMALTDDMKLPELYIEDKIPNENIPLGWSQSLLVKGLTL